MAVFLHGSWGLVPGCLSSWALKSRSRRFFSLHVHFDTSSPGWELLLHCREPLVSSHVTRLCFSSWSAGCVLRRRLLMPVSSLSACDSWFRLARLSRAHLLHVALLSRCSARDFFSGLFLQLHLVVVYSDVAFGWSLQHCCVVLCYGASRWT